MSLYDIITTMIGVPNGFGGELILYTLSAILLLTVIESIFRLFYLLAGIHRINN